MKTPVRNILYILVYYALLVVGVLLCIGAFLLTYILSIYTGIKIQSIWEIGDFPIALIIKFVLFGLFFLFTRYLLGLGVYLIDYATYAAAKYEKSYIAIYGEDFKKPSLSDFGLVKEEYYSFAKKRIDDTSFFTTILTPLPFFIFVSLSSLPSGSFKFFLGIFFLLIGAFSSWLFRIVIKSINKYFLKKMPQYEKAILYSNACEIYSKIQNEKRDSKSKKDFKGWNDYWKDTSFWKGG